MRDSSFKSGIDTDSIIERFKFSYPASTGNSVTQLGTLHSKKGAKMVLTESTIAVPSPRAFDGNVSTATQRQKLSS